MCPRALLIGALVRERTRGLGVRARSVLRLPGLRQVDGLLGGALTACAGSGSRGLRRRLAMQTTARCRFVATCSSPAILTELNRLLPPSGPI